MRLPTLVLAALLLLMQYPLWFGKGSLTRVAELDRQVTAKRSENERLRGRNAVLDAEVRDLKQGYDAIEERARAELGLIRKDEVFFRVMPEPSSSAEPGPARN